MSKVFTKHIANKCQSLPSIVMNQISLKSINTTVVFLNDNQHCFKFNKQAKGHELLNAVFQHLDLVENEYFGLKFSENVQNPFMANTDDMRWLNPEKSIKKQMRGCSFYFGVKYYASNPNSLLEITRYQLYLQLRKDILLGKLFISFSSACILGSYTIQSEFGDFSEEVHKPGYLSKFIFIQEQSEELEHQISELHKIHKGLSKSDAVMNFLDHSKHLSMYGIHLYKAKDSNNKDLEIGVVSNGIVIFQNNIRINTLSWSKIIKLSFKRKHFFVRLRKETSEDYDTILGLNMMTNRSSKHLWTTCVEYYSFFQLHKLHIQSNSQGFRKFLLGLRFSYSRQTETQSVEENYNPKQHTFFRFKSKTMSKQPVKNNTENKNKNCIIKSTTSKGSHDNKIKSFDIEPKLAWDNSCICNDENELKITPICPENIINDKAMKNHDIITSNIYDIPAYEMESLDSDENIVCINLNSDEEGRFGFNVKGGSDLGLPIIVSRVVPNTPAHRSEPKLYEGDQILMINGQELSHMVHDKIINLIQSAKDLILTVKQTSNDHCRKLLEEPFFQYIPDSLKIMSSDPLEQSILLLGDSLASGSILKQFEQLYRHKPNTSMDKAKSVHNKNKNRYLDIAPYDYTRYVLKDIENDYINASHINMNIPGSGIINQYIATQGPLQATVNDFWTMVLESRSSVIVMLTALIEKRHHKCFKYWPDLNESLEFNNLLVKTVSEETNNTSNNIVYRKINLTEIISNETRSITHLQFNSWPDHGVPEDSNCLLNLVEAIRKLRTGIVEPIIIHCSAGVGRTGVIILLDTALCLIEANQPVFPLEIVRQMRDQRAMMVQTKNQYKFVCNCIYHAYTQGQVKPLPEYK